MELKNLEHFYFHNCLYEGVWKDNHRRHKDKLSTFDILNKYGSDYKVIFVGDAAMSPYEVVYPGGAVENWNEESGETWLRRALDQWPQMIWINPVKENGWRYTQSTQMIQQLFSGRMYPLTLAGLDAGMKELS
jgi:uncharacterized protein with von Willebrand factor type A (vWA) domain